MIQGECAMRLAIVDACLNMNRLGINQGTSGNISVRWMEGFLITASGIPYHKMTPDDIVFMNIDGSYTHELNPSSEWRFHRDILQCRPDVNSVVHAHSPYCTAFAICGKDIPAIHYMMAATGGPTVRCSRYQSYGTPELSVAALEALKDRNCCLLGNHGMISTGSTLDKALWLAIELEALCRQYAIALQVGTPQILADAEIMDTVERFKSYGLNSTKKTD